MNHREMINLCHEFVVSDRTTREYVEKVLIPFFEKEISDMREADEILIQRGDNPIFDDEIEIISDAVEKAKNVLSCNKIDA